MGDSDSQQHPRLVLRSFLSPEICKELVFIHKSCCTVGYRPSVFSTTLSHLIATNSAHLIMPLIPLRERLKEKVEEHFGCEYELFVEFTGLVSWCRGASIGWHSDDNRDYLKQRAFAAVCYLNTHELDFKGGLFHFQDGEPSTVAPMAGDIIIYTADKKNIHSVSKVIEGERITLTLWFSFDRSHDEDAKLLNSLSGCSLNSPKGTVASYFPVHESNNMYWFPPEEASRFHSGFDICCARLHVLGFDIVSSHGISTDSLYNFLDLLKEPLHLACGDEQLPWEFVNILHALQVVQFYHWKALGSDIAELKGSSVDLTPVSELQRHQISCLKAVLLKDLQLAQSFFSDTNNDNNLEWSVNRLSFAGAINEWEAYTCKLLNEIVLSLPYWIKNQSVFSVVNLD